MRKFGVLILFVLASSLVVSAQTGKVSAEIAAVRNAVAQAIKNKDKTVLERIFADEFVHTHATGKVVDKKQRIAALLEDDEPTIESAPPDEIRIRAFGSQTAVATGRTTITSGGKKTSYRWTAVYYKTGGGWRLAATQGTISAE